MNTPTYPITRSDLAALSTEVLRRAADASLPCNLSDDWLARIDRDLNVSFDGLQLNERAPVYDDGEPYLAAPLALVIRILMGKNGDNPNPVHIDWETLEKHLRQLRMEIALDVVKRRTHLRPSSATLKNIFENRTVTVAEAWVD